MDHKMSSRIDFSHIVPPTHISSHRFIFIQIRKPFFFALCVPALPPGHGGDNKETLVDDDKLIMQKLFKHQKFAHKGKDKHRRRIL